MSYKRRCELKGGTYIKTVTTDAHGTMQTIEECHMQEDLACDVAELSRALNEHIRNHQALPTDFMDRIQQIQSSVNTASEKMQSILNDTRQIVTQYNALVNRVNALEDGQKTSARDIAGIKGRLAQIPSGSQNDVRGTGYAVREGLPCWLAGYGEVQLNKNYGYLMGSEGVELGCRLFGSKDVGFVTALGGGYANRYFDHHLMDVHAMFGLDIALGASTDLLLTGAGKVFRTTTFETGTASWYGLLPEIRYTLDQNNPWFLGARFGLGVTNSAPPRPEEMANQRAAHFDENAWLLLGYAFGREPAKPRQNIVALPDYGNSEVKNEVDDSATVTVTRP
ncbi:MAG: hypothetical protein WC766_00090 [Patescibacteria group bacterium]